ncbi:dihydroflavonol-4-reductase [Rhizodiscina lignyota]|uniref:Dihydroflavonol-4-reductase n=1 Tax=Rhizodiscina lignyota TaxID=1504668 RepID=A0A9P4IB01_9PEZI|nr:dihydroflavonol-4-reductase [Rhizodiscina lignyota]
MKVLLTGGSGFVAVHCLDKLLTRGQEVVTTVRSAEKGQFLLDMHRGKNLSYTLVDDIAQEGAFDEAIKATQFDAVIHTASPFHYNIQDNKRDLIDTAIIGTTGILKAIKAYAPSVKRVVILSGFAAIVNPGNHPKTYNEDSWNPITMDEALTTTNGHVAYEGSKTFAERAAWEFVEREKPGFTLAVLNPPMVFGPVIQHLKSLDDVNTSNKRFLSMVQGKFRPGDTGPTLWVDVRHLAEAHVLAIEKEEAAGKRFLITCGSASEKEIGDAIKKNFPQISNRVPSELKDNKTTSVDTRRSRDVLGLHYTLLEPCVVDVVKSLLEHGA